MYQVQSFTRIAFIFLRKGDFAKPIILPDVTVFSKNEPSRKKVKPQ